MGNQENIWLRLRNCLFVIEYKSIDDLKKYIEAIKSVGININECSILAIVESKKEKRLLPEEANVVFLSQQEFNFLGTLKNEQAKKLFSQTFDLQFYTVDPPRRIAKLLNKMKKKMSVGVNCATSTQNVNLKTDVNTPHHLINFAKQTLEKIV
ncbi:MAG: hypothetical protein MK105_09045 [Crocinitomicaceae bacterium]|nr:hypothetical protein [Crocinitomicaceae bacterium]